jgi:hypothetical protein
MGAGHSLGASRDGAVVGQAQARDLENEKDNENENEDGDTRLGRTGEGCTGRLRPLAGARSHFRRYIRCVAQGRTVRR